MIRLNLFRNYSPEWVKTEIPLFTTTNNGNLGNLGNIWQQIRI